jgi:hypothetical protein
MREADPSASSGQTLRRLQVGEGRLGGCVAAISIARTISNPLLPQPRDDLVRHRLPAGFHHHIVRHIRKDDRLRVVRARRR